MGFLWFGKKYKKDKNNLSTKEEPCIWYDDIISPNRLYQYRGLFPWIVRLKDVILYNEEKNLGLNIILFLNREHMEDFKGRLDEVEYHKGEIIWNSHNKDMYIEFEETKRRFVQEGYREIE